MYELMVMPQSEGMKVEEISEAESITVCEPGPNMLWVEIEWEDRTRTFSTKATPKNKMLFKPSEFSFDGKSLYTILFEDAHSKVTLSEEPLVAIKPGPYNDTYRLWFDSRTDSVLTPPDLSTDLLNAIIKLEDNDSAKSIKEIYEKIKEDYVNRTAIISLIENGHYDKSRIEIEGDGIVIDGYFLLTWEQEFFLYTDSWKDGAFTPYGDSKEKPGEFREISISNIPQGTRKIDINGVVYEMGGKEHIFLRKLEWILNWEDNIDSANVESIKRTVPIIQENDI